MFCIVRAKVQARARAHSTLHSKKKLNDPEVKAAKIKEKQFYKKREFLFFPSDRLRSKVVQPKSGLDQRGAIFVFLAKMAETGKISEKQNFRLKIGDFEAKAQTAPDYKHLCCSCRQIAFFLSQTLSSLLSLPPLSLYLSSSLSLSPFLCRTETVPMTFPRIGFRFRKHSGVSNKRFGK